MTFVILRGLEAGRNAEGRAMEATGGGGGAEGSHSREGNKSLLQGLFELSSGPFRKVAEPSAWLAAHVAAG